MKPKIIQNEAEYQAALETAATLDEAQPGTPEIEELELFRLLIRQYEEKRALAQPPGPIEAIKARMEQLGLTRKDLEQYIGSQSKVSEVLSGKRPLSLAMIRSLQSGLGIPAEVLLQEPKRALTQEATGQDDYPFDELFRMKYFDSFNGSLTEARKQKDALLQGLFQGYRDPLNTCYCLGSSRPVSEKALRAWQARAFQLAARIDLPLFQKGKINELFAHRVISLSYFSAGPLNAIELLRRKGIRVVFLPAPSGQLLDGACFQGKDGAPVLAITLLNDRLDQFWQVLAHLLSHVLNHVINVDWAFLDALFDENGEDLEAAYQQFDYCNRIEQDANAKTKELLIPRKDWGGQCAYLLKSATPEALERVTDELEVSAAVVAARLRMDGIDPTPFIPAGSLTSVKKILQSEL